MFFPMELRRNSSCTAAGPRLKKPSSPMVTRSYPRLLSQKCWWCDGGGDAGQSAPNVQKSRRSAEESSGDGCPFPPFLRPQNANHVFQPLARRPPSRLLVLEAPRIVDDKACLLELGHVGHGLLVRIGPGLAAHELRGLVLGMLGRASVPEPAVIEPYLGLAVLVSRAVAVRSEPGAGHQPLLLPADTLRPVESDAVVERTKLFLDIVEELHLLLRDAVDRATK
mmetsp:Transcript_118185/g.376749  ORF Transcript_118185/g.376749 Transcript_118185/m.376749 type:complete len:224 (-) Transcript_118185:716-1387(-)